MKLSDFDFKLPPELIAQYPRAKRDESDLLVPCDKDQYKIIKFHQIIDLLNPGDLMIFNNSKVIKAQLSLPLNALSKPININLNRPLSDNIWLGFAKPAKKLTEGDIFKFDTHQVIINKKLDNGEVEIEFILDKLNVFAFLEQYGQMPLPQYIKRQSPDKMDDTRYQNIYCQKPGSVAAPTAGLHFTNQLLEKIKSKKVEIDFVTLHVGAGTFLPVKTENINDHKMHLEYYEIDPKTADKINLAKKSGRRVIAVGSTSMRTLEASASHGKVHPGAQNTDIFITPGYQFQIVDTLITNFHLPKSTLFMLICAFGGFDQMTKTYHFAIQNNMRFFSYGDAMILHKN